MIAAVLPAAEWQARTAAHEARIDRWAVPHRERRTRGESHPVHDFLFTYYSETPGRVRRWHPGVGTALAPPPDGPAPHAEWRWYRTGDDGTVAPRPGGLPRRPRQRRCASCTSCSPPPRAGRCSPAASGCTSGRWSTAPTSAGTRCPLRLGQAGTDAVVEAHPIRCTHFDAFRFFTPAGRRPQPPAADPGEPDRDWSSRAACTRRWTSTSGPTSSAPPSPVSCSPTASSWPPTSASWTCGPRRTTCSDLGYAAVAIETAEGKAEYAAAQRGFAAPRRRAAPTSPGRLRDADPGMRRSPPRRTVRR